jgi:hypothetical protein
MNIEYAERPALLGEPGTFSPGNTIDVGNGEVAVIKPNGKYLSVDPTGTMSERDGVGGSYERFRLDPDLNVLRVRPRVAQFAIPYREV